MSMKKTFKNKQELVEFVKITDQDAYLVMPLFNKYGIACERHFRDRWFVYVY